MNWLIDWLVCRLDGFGACGGEMVRGRGRGRCRVGGCFFSRVVDTAYCTA